jgi:hypothetical protein
MPAKHEVVDEPLSDLVARHEWGKVPAGSDRRTSTRVLALAPMCGVATDQIGQEFRRNPSAPSSLGLMVQFTCKK